MATQRRTVSELARTETSKETRRRDEALVKIRENDALNLVYESERDAYARQTEDNLLFYWDRGRAATDVKRNAEYGQGAIDLLADALMVDRSLVYKTITMYSMYEERSALQAKMEEAVRAGHKLTWSHMSVIVHVPEAKTGADIHAKRHQMVDVVIQNGLTSRATQAEIMSRYRENPHGSDAEAGGPPRSLGGVLKQVATFSEKSMEKLTATFDDMTARLHATTGDKVKVELIDSLAADAESLKKLGEKAKETATLMEREAVRLRREQAKAKPAEPKKAGAKVTPAKAGSRTPGRVKAGE